MKINIRAESNKIRIGFNNIVATLSLLYPSLFRNKSPAVALKITVNSRCDIMSHHSAFNQDSSASAARVIHCMIMPKPRKRAKCGGKSFSYRCVISFGTISSFMKSPSGSIKHNCHFVFHNRKLNLMNRTGFLKPRYAIILFKRLNYCFFYYLLAIGNGMKSRINAVTLNGKCIA